MKLIKDGKEYNLVNNGVRGYGYDSIVINNKVYELEPAEVEYADKPFDGKVILLTKKQAKEIVHLSETLGLKILNEIAEKTR